MIESLCDADCLQYTLMHFQNDANITAIANAHSYTISL